MKGIADEPIGHDAKLVVSNPRTIKCRLARDAVTRPKVAPVPGSPFYEAERKYWEKKRDAFIAANETPEASRKGHSDDSKREDGCES